jgi:hypothetical protein
LAYVFALSAAKTASEFVMLQELYEVTFKPLEFSAPEVTHAIELTLTKYAFVSENDYAHQ